MRLIVVIISLASLWLSGCTITIKPIPTQPAVKQKKKHTTSHKAKSTPTKKDYIIVDAEWMTVYIDLKQKHGNYNIPADARIEAMSDGRFKVPLQSVKHFRDLSITPVLPKPSPTPISPLSPISP